MTSEQRVVFELLASKVLAPSTDTPYVVGINGKDAAGKSTFADKLAEYLGGKTKREIIRISVDDFMNPLSVQHTPTSSAAESAYLYTINFDAFRRFVLQPLSPGGNLVYKAKVFDAATDQPAVADDMVATSDAIVIIDGVLLYKDAMARLYDLKVVLDVTDDTAMKRGVERDIASGDKRSLHDLFVYRSTYIATQAIYYREDRPVEQADILVDNNDYDRPRVIGR